MRSVVDFPAVAQVAMLSSLALALLSCSPRLLSLSSLALLISSSHHPGRRPGRGAVRQGHAARVGGEREGHSLRTRTLHLESLRFSASVSVDRLLLPRFCPAHQTPDWQTAIHKKVRPQGNGRFLCPTAVSCVQRPFLVAFLCPTPVLHFSKPLPFSLTRGCGGPRPGTPTRTGRSLHCTSKTLPLPCVSAAFLAKTVPLPCDSAAFVTKTLPLPCGPQVHDNPGSGSGLQECDRLAADGRPPPPLLGEGEKHYLSLRSCCHSAKDSCLSLWRRRWASRPDGRGPGPPSPRAGAGSWAGSHLETLWPSDHGQGALPWLPLPMAAPLV